MAGVLDQIGLMTAAEVDALRRGKPLPKGLPAPLVKQEKAKTKAQQEKEFRASVWDRDQWKSRATGKPLGKSGANWLKVGEVHHVLKRSTYPADRLNQSNGILLSKQEHALAETHCPSAVNKMLLEITGPADLGKPQTFVWRDVSGKELRRRVG